MAKGKLKTLDDLTRQQQLFVVELLASDTFSPKEAAEKAGYKQPGVAGWKLLRNAAIKRALGRMQRERAERCQLKADDVLGYLKNVLYFNPLQYFKPSRDGGWLVTDPESLPEWVGRLIESMEVKVRETEEATSTYFKVQIVSKSTALALAMKHVGVEKHEVKHSFDWDSLYAKQVSEDQEDPIEAEILSISHSG